MFFHCHVSFLGCKPINPTKAVLWNHATPDFVGTLLTNLNNETSQPKANRTYRAGSSSHFHAFFFQRKWSNSILTHWKFNMDILRHTLSEPLSTTTPFIPSTGGIPLSKAPNFPSKKTHSWNGGWRLFPMRKPTLESYLEFPKKMWKSQRVFWSFQTCKEASMVVFTSFHMFDVLETSVVLEPPLKAVLFWEFLRDSSGRWIAESIHPLHPFR